MTAANKATLINSINKMGLDGSRKPVGAQMKHAGDYFEGHLAGYDSPTLYACQPSFAILITDGKATSTDPVDRGDKVIHARSFEHFHRHTECYRSRHRFCLAAGRQRCRSGPGTQERCYCRRWKLFRGAKLGPIGKSAAKRNRPDPRGDFLIRDAGGADHGHLGQYPGLSGVVSIESFASFLARISQSLYPGLQRFIQVDSDGIPLASSIAWDAGQVLSTTTASSRTIYTRHQWHPAIFHNEQFEHHQRADERLIGR